MIIVLLASIAGIAGAIALDIYFPQFLGIYVSVAIIVALDSVLGAIKAEFENEFKISKLLVGLFTNVIFSAFMIFLGEKIGVELHYPVIIVFVISIFNSFSKVRHQILKKFDKN